MTDIERLPYDKLPLIPIPEETNSRFYSSDHPIHHLKHLESDLFSHHGVEKIPNVNKRRKLLRRVERKLNALENNISPGWQTLEHKNATETIDASAGSSTSGVTTLPPRRKPKSLWDLRETPEPQTISKHTRIIGPKTQTLYTIKNNQIVRLEPTNDNRNSAYRTSELVVPTNKAETIILEGKKLSLDDIKSLPKFSDYNPGNLSKVLFLKNIACRATVEDLRVLFESVNFKPQIRLLSGRMRGQAFATFRNDKYSTDALDKLNGIIFKGKPLIIQYGRGERI